MTKPAPKYDDYGNWVGPRRAGGAVGLTYAQWSWAWATSGLWDQRGSEPGQWRMCRYDTAHPFQLGNIYFKQVRPSRSTKTPHLTQELADYRGIDFAALDPKTLWHEPSNKGEQQ